MTLFAQKKRDFMISLIRFSNAAANYDYIFFYHSLAVFTGTQLHAEMAQRYSRR